MPPLGSSYFIALRLTYYGQAIRQAHLSDIIESFLSLFSRDMRIEDGMENWIGSQSAIRPRPKQICLSVITLIYFNPPLGLTLSRLYQLAGSNAGHPQKHHFVWEISANCDRSELMSRLCGGVKEQRFGH